MKKVLFRILCCIGYLSIGLLGNYLFNLLVGSAVDSAQVPHLFRSHMDDSNIFLMTISVVLMVGSALMAIGSLLGIHDDNFKKLYS